VSGEELVRRSDDALARVPLLALDERDVRSHTSRVGQIAPHHGLRSVWY
jgi:hypothetical protein